MSLCSWHTNNFVVQSVLIKVHNDIVTAIDNGYSVILVLLDLSAAFNTVDHMILLRRLSTCFGICNRAFDWFVSYLSDCMQIVEVEGNSSHSSHLTRGVPQGSVLEPILYSLYTSPLGDIARHHNMMIHSFIYLLKPAVWTTRLEWKPVFLTLIYGWCKSDSS